VNEVNNSIDVFDNEINPNVSWWVLLHFTTRPLSHSPSTSTVSRKKTGPLGMILPDLGLPFDKALLHLGGNEDIMTVLAIHPGK
jgi:hypothetical protein